MLLISLVILVLFLFGCQRKFGRNGNDDGNGSQEFARVFGF